MPCTPTRHHHDPINPRCDCEMAYSRSAVMATRRARAAEALCAVDMPQAASCISAETDDGLDAFIPHARATLRRFVSDPVRGPQARAALDALGALWAVL